MRAQFLYVGLTGLADVRRAATAALQRAGRQPESVRECRPALAHSELAVDGVLKRLAASGGQLITARLNDGLVARRPLEVDRGAPAASTVDTVSIRSAHGPRATIVRATTRGGAATPGILERVNLDDDRRLRPRSR